MVEEKKSEAEVVEEATQAIEVPPPPTAEQLQETITKLTADIESAKREAKSHQEYGRKQKEELDRQRGLDTKVSGLETRLEVVTEMLADIIDRGEQEPEEQPKKRRSEEYLARLKSQPKVDIDKQRELEEYREAATEADGLVKSIGLEMDKSPETRIAYLLFKTGDYKAGLTEVKRLVENKKPPETEAKKVELSEDAEETIFRKIAVKKGLLLTDLGQPSGPSGSVSEAYAKFARREISEEEAVKAGVKF